MKGIAVRTIILMVIGLLIAGVVVFMVYKYVVGAPLSEQRCRSLAINWCTMCKNANGGNWTKDVGTAPSSDLQDCASKYFGGAPSKCQNEKDWCSAFISV